MSGRRIRFLADYDYKPRPQVTIAYKAGKVEFVHLECAEKAVAAGKAEYVEIGAPPAGLSATLARLKNGKR